MPTTYNGIGTHYYGKRNLSTREQTCPHCGRQATLASYDTRLWFVVVFIPLIPIARKRIIDYCSSCTRHHAADLEKWQTASQLEISGAAEQYRANPTPEKAIALHQQLTGFHQTARADEFRAEMAQKFASNATVHSYLGFALERQGKNAESITHFNRALELRPDLPEARIGLAMDHIRHARLDEAARLLEFLEKPGAAQLYSLEPLEHLGNAFQKASRHSEAMRCFDRILSEIPAVAQNKAFRKKVAKSEKAAGRPQSALPKQKFNWRNLFIPSQAESPSGFRVTKAGLAIFACCAAFSLGTFIFSDYFLSQHRKVFVVNGFNDKVRFSVDDGSPITLGSHRVHEMTVPEGSHTATFEGDHAEQVQFEIRTPRFSRWFGRPVWIVNPGGAAILQHETVTYAKDPIPASLSLAFGQSFYEFQNINHPFSPLPEKVTVSSRSATRVLTRIALCEYPPEAMFRYLLSTGQRGDALLLAESQLKLNPSDEMLLRSYLGELDTSEEVTRGEKFLEKALAVRPVPVELHRAWQNLVEKSDPGKDLADVYDDFLSREPKNSTLLYLRGRVSNSPEDRVSFYQKALDANPTNAWAHFGLGFHFLSRADWPQAEAHYARARELDPANDGFSHYYTLARLAAGQAQAVETDLRAHLEKEPHFYSIVALLPILGSQNKISEAEAVITAFVRRLRKEGQGDVGEVVKPLRRLVAYSAQNFSELESLSREKDSIAYVLASALVEQNKMAEAEACVTAKNALPKDPFAALIFSVAWHLAGDADKAKTWSDRALEEFQHGSKEERAVSKILNCSAAPTDDQLFALTSDLRERAILAAFLKFRHPGESARFSKWIERFNVECTYPYYLLKRVASAT